MKTTYKPNETKQELVSELPTGAIFRFDNDSNNWFVVSSDNSIVSLSSGYRYTPSSCGKYAAEVFRSGTLTLEFEDE